MVLIAALVAAWTAQAGDPSYAPDFYQVVVETYFAMESGQDPLIEYGVSDENRKLFHDTAEKIVEKGKEIARRHLDTLCHFNGTKEALINFFEARENELNARSMNAKVQLENTLSGDTLTALYSLTRDYPYSFRSKKTTMADAARDGTWKVDEFKTSKACTAR